MSSFELRPLAADDRNGAEWVLISAFGGGAPVSGSIIDRHLALGPDTSFVAVRPEDGRIAGVVCAVIYGAPPALAYIGPMAVAPDFQGQGLGGRLFARLMERIESAGCRTALLDATDAGEPLYRKFGFAEAGWTYDLRREETGARMAPLACQLRDLAESDRGTFGFDRTAVLDRLLVTEKAAGFVSANASGHLVAQARVLGPFGAPDPDTAARLLDAALEAGSSATRALAPAENPHARALLEQRGFRVEREVRHMSWGQPAAGMRRDWIYGLASFALG